MVQYLLLPDDNIIDRTKRYITAAFIVNERESAVISVAINESKAKYMLSRSTD